MDNATGGAFIDLTFTEAVDMLERMTKTSRAWHTRDSMVVSNTGSSVILVEQHRREDDHDQDMAHIKTQMDLLMKHLLLGNIEKVKIWGPMVRKINQTLRKRLIILHIQGVWIGGQGNQGWNHQGDWKNKSDRIGLYVPPGSRDNAATSSGKISIEDMMEKLLKRVKATNSRVTTMQSDISSMSQLVNLHSIAIKQLE